MSIVDWIILGLIAGFIASKIVNQEGEDLPPGRLELMARQEEQEG